jgi:hypothetical protein
MMSQNIDQIRDHYQAAIADQDAMIAKISTALDGMDGPTGWPVRLLRPLCP